MKKRQRKKNAKKALGRMKVALLLVQAQTVLSQIQLNRNLKTGGIVGQKTLNQKEN